MLTTQHYTLQGARAQALSDLQNRSTLFLSAVSGALIALSFLGQSTRTSDVFSTFAAVVFPVWTVMGLLTYVRGLELESEDVLHARGIARIRQFYVETTPGIREFIIHTTHDDIGGMVADMGIKPNALQPLLTAPTMVGLVTIILAASSAWSVAAKLGARTTGELIGSVLAALIAAALLWFLSIQVWRGVARSNDARSPSPPAVTDARQARLR